MSESLFPFSGSVAGDGRVVSSLTEVRIGSEDGAWAKLSGPAAGRRTEGRDELFPELPWG